MLHKLSIAVFLAALISTGIAGKVSAASLTESVDVGELLPNAGQTNSQPASTSLDSISGSLGGGEYIDLYQIYLPVGTFTASIGVPGQNTQLFLFDASGIGVIGSDDDLNNNFLPNISTNISTAGNYYLGISIVGYDPQSSGGSIFNFNGGATDPTTPNGLGAASPLSSWSTGLPPDAEEGYSISLSGAQFVGSAAAAAVVPFDFNPTFGVGMFGIWTLWQHSKRGKSQG